MAVDANTLDALDLQKLTLPPSPPVTELRAEDYIDSSGEDSLQVFVILAENADVERLSGKDVGTLKSTIRDSLRRHGVTRFVYFTLAKPSELAKCNDDE